MSEHDPNLVEAAKAVENLNKGFEEFKKSNDARLAEIEKKGQPDPILEEKLAKIEADLNKAQKVADDAALAAKRRNIVMKDEKGNEVDPDEIAFKWARLNAKRRGTDVKGYDARQMGEYKAAFMEYLRNDDKALSGDEAKALSVGSDPDGGYVVHPDMSGRTVRRIFETSPMRAYASVQSISTDALEGLFDLDESGFGWVAETEGRPETTTPQIKRWRIPVHEMYANPAATQRILDDAEINIEAWLADKVADKLSRAEAAAFVNGDGVDKPRGFLTYPDRAVAEAYELGAIEQYDTGVNGDFAAAPNGGDVLIDALFGLKTQYRSNATWFMNRTTMAKTRKVKDSDGAYLWSPGIAAGQPSSLLGYPVASFEDMPDPATGSLSIAVGDMRSAYQIVDRAGIRVLRDPYLNKPYVHFYTTKRVGGDVVDFDALRIVRFAA